MNLAANLQDSWDQSYPGDRVVRRGSGRHQSPKGGDPRTHAYPQVEVGQGLILKKDLAGTQGPLAVAQLEFFLLRPCEWSRRHGGQIGTEHAERSQHQGTRSPNASLGVWLSPGACRRT